MKVCITGDFHWLGQPEIPDCDLLLLHGDLGVNRFGTTRYEGDEQSRLVAWLEQLAGRNIHVVAIAGNHDHDLDPLYQLHEERLWTFLHDSSLTLRHNKANPTGAPLKIWGTPWSVTFNNWAWMASDADLVDTYAEIPDDVDIIVSHTPPYGYCDLAQGVEHVGSQALRDRALGLKQLRLIACGHVHEGYGVTFIPDTNTENKHAVVVANGSYVDARYTPGNPPIILDL